MANIIVIGTTQVASADFAVTAGVPSTVFMTTTDGSLPARECYAEVQMKAASGQYMTVGVLGRNSPALVIDGPGTFRVFRNAQTSAFGVDRD